MKRTTKNIFVRIGHIMFIAAFMMLAVSAKITRDQQQVNDLVISIDHASGHFFITDEDVSASVNDLLPESGTVIHNKDLKDLESKLKEMPQTEKSNVFVNNKGHLTIEIVQRKPLYRVIRQNGTSYYVDHGGFKFPVSSKYTARVPVVTGFIAADGKTSGPSEDALNAQLLKVFHFLEDDKFWKAQFGQLEVSDKGELRLIPRMGGHFVLLGDAEDLEGKMNRLRIFYHEALPKAGWEKYKIINVKYKDQVVCTK